MEKQIESQLEKEGWYLQAQVVHQTLEQLVQSNAGEDDQNRGLEGALRTELLDTDIRRIGTRSLPDAQSFLHTRILQGLRVLQILSVNDISQSSTRAIAGSNPQSRLLRFRLTDGHTTVTAIEFRPIPSVSQDLPPGTKVVLGTSVPVHTGVLLLDANCIRVLGGHVQAMYDAWEMERKYSGVAREAANKSLLPEGVTGPPPFRALQLGRKTCPGHVPALQTGKQDFNSRAVLDGREQSAKGSVRAGEVVLTQAKKDGFPSKPKPAIRPGAEPYRPRVGGPAKEASSTVNSVEGTPSPPTSSTDPDSVRPEPSINLNRTEKTIDEQSIPVGLVPSGLQPGVAANPPSGGSLEMKVDERSKHIDQNIKEAISLGIDNTPIQNRKAAQKLLEKSVDTDWRRGGGRGGDGRGRGGRRGGRGREREDDESTMTLDEWEARKSSGNSSVRDANTSRPGASHATDEELAWRLQQQFDLEGSRGGPSKEIDPAEQLRASMFNFTPGVLAGEEDGRGRGRGRERGRGRGRGRRHG